MEISGKAWDKDQKDLICKVFPKLTCKEEFKGSKTWIFRSSVFRYNRPSLGAKIRLDFRGNQAVLADRRNRMIKEISPATVEKAQRIASLLEEAQLLSNELIANDQLKVLKIDGDNIDLLIMKIKYKVLDYRQDIRNAMAHKF
jgi:hypothetical protein